MKTSILTIFLLLALNINLGFAQCEFTNTSFKNGERLKYTGYYQLGMIWISAGKVEISVNKTSYKGKDTYKVVGTGRSAKAFDSFYRLRDTMVSYMDTKTLTPYYYHKITHEKNYYSKDILSYDYRKNKAYYTKVKKSGIRRDTIKMDNICFTDLVSIAYQSRNINFEELGQGSYVSINMIVGGKKYKVFIRYLGHETIKTKRKKRFTCYKLAPTLPEGSMFKGGNMLVWLSKDENKIPIMVESKVVIGKVKGIIEDYKNLRNPSNF